MAISSNETSTDILSITVIPRGKKVAFQALKSDITTVPSPVELTGDLDWTVELRETSFEVAVNGHFVASIPHSEPVNRMDTLIFTDSFPTSRIVFHLNGDPHNTPGKYAISGNLAFKKKTSSSSSRVGHPSSRVTDGMTIVDWQQDSCWSVSEGDSNPWWMVDLGSVYYINHLVLTSRHCDSTCANRLHDFEIEVFKEDPSVNTTAVGARCTMYVGAVPDGSIQKVTCDEEVVGRFVRISGRNPADNADVLTLCEVEVYGGIRRTGWSPFECPNPPLLTGAAVTVSHTNTRAVAKYTCSHGAMVCAGHDVIHCSSQAGWDREPGSCVQTSLDAGKPGSLEDFPICPLALGGSLELWVTPTEDEGSLILHGESGATLSGSMTLQNATAPVSLSYSVSGSPSPAVYPASNPFTKNKESHIVISHLTKSLLIEVDGATLYNYPIDDFSSENVNVVTWTAGLSVRKATFSQTMRKELDRERIQFNMALNAFVDASSTDNVPTSYGVDGDPNMTSTKDTDNDSCWRGQKTDHKQWYQVDLGKQVYIRDIGINIKNQCITCATRLHDFSVLVYTLNPETERGVAGTLCTQYAGDVASDAPITLTCRDEVWGRYVRVTADHAGQMSICEIEIYGDSVVRKEWSPLDCGPAPMAGKARVSIASSTRESVASYSCPEGMSLYEGTPTLVCDSSKGWVGQVGTCLQTTFRATGTDLLQQVQLLSPPRIGEAVEVVFTPRNPWSRVSLIASSIEQDVVLMVIAFTKDRAKLISGGTSAVVDIPGFPFQDGKRTKVLYTFFSQYIDISVDGLSVYAYPFLFPVDLIDGVFTTGATRVSVLPKGITGTTWTQLTRNLAWNKPAVGSTANGESDPGNAVDGNKAMQLTSQSCWTVDNGDLDPWWTVDLGSFYKVTHVEITSRVSCGELCDKRLHDFKIELFNKQPLARDKGELCLQHDGVFPPATTKTLTCTTTAVGRYLRISSPGRTDGGDLFTLCEVQVFGDEFIKEESSQSDCKEPPPRPHAMVSVMRTGRGVTASYSCEAGYGLCGERQHSTCVDGIWGEFNGHCFQNVWHYSTPHTIKDHPLTCPLSLNSEVTLIATPVINTDFTTSLRIGNTSIIKLEASFTAYGYKEATVQVQESGRETYRYRLPIFPFDIGKEFTLLMKVLPTAIELHVDGRMVHDPSLPGIPVETRMDGPPVLNTEGLATRRLTYHVSNERYHMIHYTHTQNRWIHVPTKDRTDIMFSVKACHSVLVNLREDRFFETPGVTFTIGGRQNTMSECTSCSNNQTTWHSVLDCETYKTFWVSWMVPGSVAIGSGKILGAEVFMTSSGHDFRKGFLRLGTTDTDGRWTFPEYESGAAPDQPCPRPDQSPSTYMTSNFLAPTPYRMSTFRCSEGHVFCGQSSQASCQDSTDLQVFKGACVSNVLPKEDAVKTKLRLPCRMENGALISVYITPNTDASRITVDVDGEYDTGLLLKLDFNARDLTAAHSGALEQSIGSFPFTRGQEFHLVIAFEPDRYQIYSDGQWVGVHASPVTHDRLSDVEVSGDFTLRDLRAYPNIMSSPDNCVVDVTHGTIQSRDTSIGSEGQVKCNANYKTCNTSSVVCGPDGKYGNTEDQTCRQYKWQFTAELTIDTDYPVPCTFRDGYGIRLIGKASRSFHVRVRAGPEDQIAFYSDMTASTTTLSTSIKDEVLFQEVIPGSPLSLYTQFVLIIEVHPDVYKVILNGDVINSYKLLSPADRAERVTITAGVAVTDLEFLDR
ncbi:uncharacterized protein LOC124144747 [Haliotis rufescens]|uniref:uncharacterized protein LOC124144747 n=1 Tax=Haliotis rufescens TaxID=6454 RepID=UPI00201EF179|nr:uncharacterized protein LOC124144747 [Haliotis rufescens]